jgi:hypothetical protein
MKPDKIILRRDSDGLGHANIPQTVIRHSPTGMEWGYGGSGPADLALNILMLFSDENTANSLYQTYKWEVIANIPEKGAEIKAEEVERWLNSHLPSLRRRE